MGARALLVLQDFEFVQHKHGRRSTLHAHTVGVHPSSYSAGTLLRKFSKSWWGTPQEYICKMLSMERVYCPHPGYCSLLQYCSLGAKNSVTSINSSFFHTECLCCMSLLCVRAACPGSLSMLHVLLHVYASCLAACYGPLWQIWLCAMGHCDEFCHALWATAMTLVMR
jgi:hypothetical protein